jgi:hypothetical protein
MIYINNNNICICFNMSTGSNDCMPTICVQLPADYGDDMYAECLRLNISCSTFILAAIPLFLDRGMRRRRWGAHRLPSRRRRGCWKRRSDRMKSFTESPGGGKHSRDLLWHGVVWRRRRRLCRRLYLLQVARIPRLKQRSIYNR